LLLPDRTRLEGSPVDWAGIFCHELAHWKRKDHVAAFLAELTVCALPWNPLAWWAKARLGQASEMACDDWVLAGGGSATDYAESLLGLVPQSRPALALAAVTSRSGLVDRIRHILGERRSSPVVGTGWAALATLAAIGATSALALAQAGPEAGDQTTSAKAPAATAKVSQAAGEDAPEGRVMKQTSKGLLLGPDGSPAKGARVLWVGRPQPSLADIVMPKTEHPTDGTRRLAEGKTDVQGRFRLEVDFETESYFGTQLVFLAPGAAILSHGYRPNEEDLTLKLIEETPVEGRILTPGGRPAADVRVSLVRVMSGDGGSISRGRIGGDGEALDYWPKPQLTDKDGRFTMKGLGTGLSGPLVFEHPDYAVDGVTVASGIEITAWMKAAEIIPVGPKFTHTLEPARPVQGVVTDKETGKPLADILVEMTPMRRHGGMRFYARTDPRAVIASPATRPRRTSPRSRRPPIRDSDRPGLAQGWPAGAKFLEKNFALERASCSAARSSTPRRRPRSPAPASSTSRGSATPQQEPVRSAQPHPL
ncbi:MAG: M56 family metallopeptidase, partial [Singulisphaera sp.]